MINIAQLTCIFCSNFYECKVKGKVASNFYIFGFEMRTSLLDDSILHITSTGIFGLSIPAQCGWPCCIFCGSSGW